MKSYYAQIAKWTLIGLAIRFMLMPFTMHGQDSCFINYFPMMFATKGIWDPYGFINANFKHFPYTYYGPVLFIIMAIPNFIFAKMFKAVSLVKILELSGGMMFKDLTTPDYVSAFSGLDLFKNLFLLKSPYLLFDFLIGAILLKLAQTKDEAVKSYRLWMLNMVVLQSVYAAGGFDVIPAFFIITSLYCAIKKRPYLSIILLSLGGATKLFAYVLILPACLLLGDNWRKKSLLFITASITTILVYLPFYLSSGPSLLRFFMLSEAVHYSGTDRVILTGTFIIFYAMISVKAVKDSKGRAPEKNLLYYFIIVLFLTYTAVPVRFRYFVSITPLLAVVIPKNKKFGIFTLFIILTLAFLWLTGRDLQLGLFSPVDPAYFMSLPTLQELMASFVNIEMCYKVMSRVSLLAFFVGALWTWRLKSVKS